MTHHLSIYFFPSGRMGSIKASFVVLYLSACHINISAKTDPIIIKLPFVWLDMSRGLLHKKSSTRNVQPHPGCLSALIVRSPWVAHRGTACARLSMGSISKQPCQASLLYSYGCSLVDRRKSFSMMDTWLLSQRAPFWNSWQT